MAIGVPGEDGRLVAALGAGACGYLLSCAPAAELVTGIREAARQVVEFVRQAQPLPRLGQRLTPHEQRLLRPFMEGANRGSAAARLGVTTHGIAFCLRNIYEKLEVRTQAEAVAKAIRAGLLGFPETAPGGRKVRGGRVATTGRTCS